MDQLTPRRKTAGGREAGVLCPSCDVEVEWGDNVVSCPDCGTVQHWICWKAVDGCSAFECQPDRVEVSASRGGSVLRISDAELESAVPLPAAPSFTGALGRDEDPFEYRESRRPVRRGWNKLAIVALLIALAGVPLILHPIGGLLAGVIALIIGCIALIGKNASRRRGLGLAVVAMMLGIGTFVGGAVFHLHGEGGERRLALQLDEFEPDPEALDELPEHINRAMKANVLIQTTQGLGLLGSGMGSGVILSIENDQALVVTNRHVVDPDYAEGRDTMPSDLSDIAHLLVKMIGQPAIDAELVWLAPHGIDLALIEVPVMSIDPMETSWKPGVRVQVGDPVFAIGNPHGLGWTHTGGDVSQLRRQHRGPTDIRVIQTSAAINPGNSGGGLYDETGRLIGINTWTRDKRVAEGIGFAIDFQTLIDMAPARFGLKNLKETDDE